MVVLGGWFGKEMKKKRRIGLVWCGRLRRRRLSLFGNFLNLFAAAAASPRSVERGS